MTPPSVRKRPAVLRYVQASVTVWVVVEFGFELQVCQWAEHHWPPDGERGSPVIVARQLGTKHRRWDTVIIECTSDGLAARARFGDRSLDSDLLAVVRGAPAEWGWYRDVLPKPSYPWRYVREAVNRAADRALIERRTRGGRVEIKRRWQYPEWVSRVIAIENKPDMDASAARDLVGQLERDIALSLAEEVWVATAESEKTAILLGEAPVEAGILTIAPGKRGAQATSVVWQPRTLAVDRYGTRILDRPSGKKHDRSGATFEYASAEWKANKRLEIAERAYERGWRSYIDSMRPDCRYFELRPTTAVSRPFCTAKGRSQTTRECSGSCPAFEPEPPTWRVQGWPVDGGPGNCVKRLLRRQRARRR